MERQSGAVDGPNAVPEGRGEKDRRIRTERESLREPDIQRGEGVFAVHDGLGPAGRARREHDVREVGSARRQGRSLICRCRPPRPDGIAVERNTPSPCPQVEAASRATSPSRTVPWRSSETRARAPVSRAAWATVSGSVRVGRARGYGAETQQRDERDLPVDDVRQKNDHDVAATDSALFQLFGEASGFPPQRAVAEPPAGCIGDGKAVLEALGEGGVAVQQGLAWPPSHSAVPAFAFGAVGRRGVWKRRSRGLRAFRIPETQLTHPPLPSPARNHRISTAIPTPDQRRPASSRIQDGDIAFFIDSHF